MRSTHAPKCNLREPPSSPCTCPQTSRTSRTCPTDTPCCEREGTSTPARTRTTPSKVTQSQSMLCRALRIPFGRRTTNCASPHRLLRGVVVPLGHQVEVESWQDRKRHEGDELPPLHLCCDGRRRRWRRRRTRVCVGGQPCGRSCADAKGVRGRSRIQIRAMASRNRNRPGGASLLTHFLSVACRPGHGPLLSGCQTSARTALQRRRQAPTHESLHGHSLDCSLAFETKPKRTSLHTRHARQHARTQPKGAPGSSPQPPFSIFLSRISSTRGNHQQEETKERVFNHQ